MTGPGLGGWLRAQRLARGWGRTEMARRLRAAVQASGSTVPGVKSITRSLAGWEDRGRYPQDRWRAAICQVLGVASGNLPAQPGVSIPSGVPADLDGDDPRSWARVARTLADRIRSGELKPGDRVPCTADIARDADVSVPTARRACAYLRARGIIRYWPGTGYYVSGGPRDDTPGDAPGAGDDVTRSGSPGELLNVIGMGILNLSVEEAAARCRSAQCHGGALAGAGMDGDHLTRVSGDADVRGGFALVPVQGGLPAQARPIAGAAACLDELAGPELSVRRALLLRSLGTAGPGEANSALAGALALAAVIAEQDTRARTYAAFAGSPYRCTCGFGCQGLAGIDEHLEQYPVDSAEHFEVTGDGTAVIPTTPAMTDLGEDAP